MKRKFELIYFFVLLFMVIGVNGECDKCQHNNPIACHGENVYSLCVNGIPTYNNITCPNGFVCTGDVFLCLPSEVVTPICPRKMSAMAISPNLCGVCASQGKVFSCLNKTTIAFCFGEDEPYYESLSFCAEGTVCDLNSGANFCTDEKLVQPSCPRDEWSIPTTLATKPTFPETTANTFTKEPSTTELSTTASTSGQTTTILQQATTLEPTTTEATTVTFDKTTTTPDVTTTPAVTTTTFQSTTIIDELTTTFGTTTDITETSTTEELTTTPEESTNTTSPAPTTSETTTASDLSTVSGEVATVTSEETTTTQKILSDETTTESTTTAATPIPTTTSEDTTATAEITTPTAPLTTTPLTTTVTTTVPTTTTTTLAKTTTTIPTTSQTTSTPTTASLTPTITTPQILTPLEICEQNGIESQTSFFALPGDTTCKNYIMCIKPGASWSTMQLTCSANKWFDPVSGKCSESYSCPSANLDTTTTTTDSTTITSTATTKTTTETKTTTQQLTTSTAGILTPLEFCARNGITTQTTFFALPGDTTCKNYIMCIKLGSNWTVKEMACSSNKWFDPGLGKCSESYRCFSTSSGVAKPSASTLTTTFVPTISTSTITTPTTAAPTTIKTTTETKPTTPQSGTTTERILTALEACKLSGIGSHAIKPLSSDATCKKYIMCSKPSSSWTAKDMICSSNKWFDPGLSKCTPDYKCPT